MSRFAIYFLFAATSLSLQLPLLALCDWCKAASVWSAQEENPPLRNRALGAVAAREPRVHDPSTIVKDGDKYWVFTTGMGVSSLRSKDLVNWDRGPAVFADAPAWITDVVPMQRGRFWLPT